MFCRMWSSALKRKSLKPPPEHTKLQRMFSFMRIRSIFGLRHGFIFLALCIKKLALPSSSNSRALNVLAEMSVLSDPLYTLPSQRWNSCGQQGRSLLWLHVIDHGSILHKGVSNLANLQKNLSPVLVGFAPLGETLPLVNTENNQLLLVLNNNHERSACQQAHKFP
jgi:hypothetical protein